MAIIQRIVRFVVAPVVVCATLTQCAWFIPQEKSSPRYNEVIGQPRRPELNPAAGQTPPPSPSSDAKTQTVAMASLPAPVVVAPAASVAAAPPVAAFPPVSPETQARADTVMARDVPPPVTASPELSRRVPVENAGIGGNVVVAQNSYPALNSVPTSPAVSDAESAARLARVRAQLEQERAAANAERTQLKNDAAAQPSMLPSGGTNATVAPPEPVVVAPIPAPSLTAPAIQPLPVQPSVTYPRSSSFLPPAPLASTADASRYVPQVNPAISAPVPNVGVSNNGAFAIPVSPQAMSAPMQEPIVLRPPQAVAMAAPNPVTASNVTNYAAQTMAPAVSGGFNPLEGSSAPATAYAPSYSTNGYLPPSRYAQRRY